MKAHLLFRDHDYAPSSAPCYGKENLSADLEVERIVSAMAKGDKTIAQVCGTLLFQSLEDKDSITYRQDVLRDAMDHPEVIRELYALCTETEKERRGAGYWLSSRSLSSTFSCANDLIALHVKMLGNLRAIADKNVSSFHSEGFCNLFSLLLSELSDAYFAEVKDILQEMRSPDGALISASFGNYLQGVSYMLCRRQKKGFRRRWWIAPSYTIASRDDAGAKDLTQRYERAINEVTNSLAQASGHLDAFFDMLFEELAFYVGCLNLHETLKGYGMDCCLPTIIEEGRSWKELYDVSLVLTKEGKVTGNDLEGEKKGLVIVTGANQGGKSTFLRSIGQAQLMAQCGMFVGADSFQCPIRNGIFTHFKKEEDAALQSGKLDEELVRMDALVPHLKRGAMMLFNESFASTNEREGSEICREITKALVDDHIEVFSVTHLFTFASSFQEDPNVFYLCAQRLENGERTFKIIPGAPKQTAYGEDLYKKICK